MSDFAGPLCRIRYVACHFVGCGALLFDGSGDGGRNIVDLMDHGSNGGDGVDRSMSIGLNGGDLVADVFGRFRRLAGEFLNFVGDYGEPFAGFSGACRFDGGIQAPAAWSVVRSR